MLYYDYTSAGFVSSGRCEDVRDIFEPDTIMATVVPINEKGMRQLEEAFDALVPGDRFTATLSNGATLMIEKPKSK